MTRPQNRDTVLSCQDCGYTTRLTTPGLAVYSLRKHSCDKQRERDERAARVAERRASSGQVRDCVHKVADHQHGTYAAYTLDRCRCRPCRDATRDYERDRTRRHLYGRFDTYTDAAPVREHVQALMGAGLGLKRIAALAGVSNATLGKLVYGHARGDGGRRPPSRRVLAATAQKVLAVRADLDVLGTRTSVEGTGTRRRLRALVARGWSMSRLGRELGGGWAHAPNACRLISGEGAVGAGTAVAVRDLYERLWDVAPPEHDQCSRIAAARARRHAAAHGWAVPLAWDEDAIDDPLAWPSYGVEDTADLSDEQIAELTGLSVANVGWRRSQARQREAS